ncbi:hypothetical protein FRC11_009172 [Ceratobasidium sp. 423]|nr:hypothetical protein FRC11_009172 [Ceratobasidium sp. 423]
MSHSTVAQDMVYDPPALPNYIHAELKPVNGPPSNEEVASVHTALRISESFANGVFLQVSQPHRRLTPHINGIYPRRPPVPSIFDPDVHVQLSQHLFDIQFARHVQRSVVKQFAPVLAAPQNPTLPDNVDANSNREVHNPPQKAAGSTGIQHAALEEPNSSNPPTNHQNPNETNELGSIKELMVEMRDTLKNMNRVMIGSQNSLARGFNSSISHGNGRGLSYDLGAHSLINDHGEVPETHNLPTFKSGGNCCGVSFAVNNLTENALARYLRFYGIGEEMIEEGEELKIRSGKIDDARRFLSGRLFLNRQ